MIFCGRGGRDSAPGAGIERGGAGILERLLDTPFTIQQNLSCTALGCAASQHGSYPTTHA